MSGITVGSLYKEMRTQLDLTLLTSKAGLKKRISQKDLHRPGLALAGFLELFTFDRIQVLGNTEIKYLGKLSSDDRTDSLSKTFEYDIPCVIVTTDNKAPSELLSIADQSGVAVFSTPLTTTELTHLLSDYLDEAFAPSTTIHGSLVDVYGTGLLFTGRSGIGKSEIALDLVERGHRLVADDVVVITKMAEGILIGKGSKMLEHLMEIRGVGIIDVSRIFGIQAIRAQKRVEMEVRLVDWDEKQDYERLGLEEQTTEMLGVNIPVVQLPIFPGKNVTVIAETIALDLHLKVYGFHPAREFGKKLQDAIHRKNQLKDYLHGDFE
ncbi:serine kinase [bacterium SM23_57]|nr:MAG: serine kinase [bacterium SM23_57]